MPTTLVQPLWPGPLDFVGDVHGEMESLCKLLELLGYAHEGAHPDGRRLVFLGDLTDRGPDNRQAVGFVQSLVEHDRAQCVLGNHDLNLLLGKRKYDNGWFYEELSDAEQRRIVEFFETLPIALERPGLRVVHAYWDAAAIAAVADATDVRVVHEEYRERIEGRHLDEIQQELALQNENPVKLLTSGPEQEAAQPVQVSGKLRHLERVKWWEDYSAEPVVVFGHYSLDASVSRQQTRAICVDFGCYKRRNSELPYKLAALRTPEWTMHADDGDMWELSLASS